MKNIFSKNLYYNINITKEQFIKKLKQRTKSNECNDNFDNYDFQGTIDNDCFQIKAIPHSRRGLFNPIICGKVFQNEETTEILIEMKLKMFDLFFPILWLIICILFSLIILNEFLENEKTEILTFILPIVLFIVVNVLFSFFAHLNFKDAKEKIESIIYDK